jgi:hypothetical protein
MEMFNTMNPDGSFRSAAIVIQSPDDLERLKACLILKKLLKINNLPETLHVNEFPVGKQLLYPNLEDNAGYNERMYVVDAKVAELFYISDFYYQAFQQIYHHKLEQIQQKLEEHADQILTE